MRTILFALISIFSFNISYAQYKIEGIVVGEQSNQPLEFVNVLIVKNNDGLITGSVTDAQGKFNLNAQEGTYTLKIERFGEILLSKEIAVNQNINLGKIAVKEVSELENVVVVGKRPTIEAKSDRIIFNVENTIVGKGGGTLIDVLKTTPGLIVQQGKIEMIGGKSGVQIFINDRPVKMTGEELNAYLEALPANEVKNIEVITMPSAKYETQGNSGVINITLKKTLENSWKDRISAIYYQWDYAYFNFSNNFNYSKDKVDIAFSLSKNAGHQKTTGDSEILYPTETWKDITNEKETPDRWSTRLGVDYKLTPNATLGVVYSGVFRDRKRVFDNVVDIFRNHILAENFKTFGDEKNKTNYQGIDIYYDQKLDTLGRKLSVMLDYFNSKNEKERVFNTTQTGKKINNGAQANIKNYNAQIDVEHPFSSIGFNYGVKVAQTQTNSGMSYFDLTSGTLVLDPTKTSDFAYTENVQAIYAEAQKEFSDKIQAKIGLRVENIQTKAEQLSYRQTTNRKHTKFLPSVNLGYTPDEMHMYSLSYSRDFDRPEFWRLDPFRYYTNEYVYMVGNPFLQQCIYDTVEFQFVYAGAFVTKLIFVNAEDGFMQFVKIDPSTHQRVYTSDNIYNKKQYVLQQMAMLSPFSWWELQGSLMVGYVESNLIKDVLDFDKKMSFMGGIVSINNNFYLNKEKTLDLAVNFQATSRAKDFSMEASSTQKLDLLFGAFFLDKKLRLEAFVDDLFGSSEHYITAKVNGVIENNYNRNFNQYAGLRASYTFGNRKVRVQEKAQGNEKEKDRSSN